MGGPIKGNDDVRKSSLVHVADPLLGRQILSVLLSIRQVSHNWSEGVHTWLKHDYIRQPILLTARLQHFAELGDRAKQYVWALKHLLWGKPKALS